MYDKTRTYDLAEGVGVPVPRHRTLRSLDDLLEWEQEAVRLVTGAKMDEAGHRRHRQQRVAGALAARLTRR